MWIEYGVNPDTGVAIEAPPGWQILPEGEKVPPRHREWCRPPRREFRGCWAQPHRSTSTMTAIRAGIWGSVYAYAVPTPEHNAYLDTCGHPNPFPVQEFGNDND